MKSVISVQSKKVLLTLVATPIFILLSSAKVFALDTYYFGRVVGNTPQMEPIAGASVFARFVSDNSNIPSDVLPSTGFLLTTTDSNGLFLIYEQESDPKIYDFARIGIQPVGIQASEYRSRIATNSEFLPVNVELSLLGVISAAGIPTTPTNALYQAALTLLRSEIPSPTLSTDIAAQGGSSLIKLTPVPEPSTTLGSILLLGFGALVKRQYSRKGKKVN